MRLTELSLKVYTVSSVLSSGGVCLLICIFILFYFFVRILFHCWVFLERLDFIPQHLGCGVFKRARKGFYFYFFILKIFSSNLIYMGLLYILLVVWVVLFFYYYYFGPSALKRELGTCAVSVRLCV